MTRWVCLAMLVASMGATAEAQCASGRATSPATAGRCCWPGQRWDVAYGRCSGPPTCPRGMGAAGEDCIAEPGRPLAVEALGGAGSRLTAPAGPTATAVHLPSPPPEGLVGLRDPRSGIHPDGPRIGGGLAVLGSGYLMGMAGGLFGGPATQWLAFVPVVHVLALVDEGSGYALAIPLTIVGGMLDLVGIWMVLDGAFRAYPHLEGDAVQVSVGPGGVRVAF